LAADAYEEAAWAVALGREGSTRESTWDWTAVGEAVGWVSVRKVELLLDRRKGEQEREEEKRRKGGRGRKEASQPPFRALESF